MDMKEIITVFTDGSSRGNPGQGGWGAVVIAHEKVTELGGREDMTTNNRMEMTAVLEALQYIEKKKYDGNIQIHTDSAYVLQGATLWMYGWARNGWKTKTGDDVLNQDIWKDISAVLFRLKQTHEVEFVKVSGHSGHIGNERVDAIATACADKERFLFYTGSFSDYERLLGGSVHYTDGSKKKVNSKKSSSKSSKKAYAYVSFVNSTFYSDSSWAACEKRVKGVAGARFKKVFSKAEEDALMREWQKDVR
jgi:ribonuclease HI